MTLTVWYISKYVALPRAKRGGTRGFMLMREMTRQGARTVMITSDANHLTQVPEFEGSTFVEEVDGVVICWLKTRKYKGAQSLGRILSWLQFEWRLLRLVKNRFPKPDAVIVSSLSLLTIVNGLLLRRRFGARLVFEVRDIWPLTLTEEGNFSQSNPFVIGLGWLERLGYRAADAIVGTIPNLRQHVHEQTGRVTGIYTIPFGVDDETVEGVEELPQHWLAEFVPKGRFVVCYAGTIGKTNALETLFECARLMVNEPIHFLLVGDGDLREEYQREYGNEPNVSFTGSVPKSMVQSVVSACDVSYFATFPSKVWDYGMSLNKIIEYMLAARPVIGSYSGYKTMIEEADCGTVVPAGDSKALQGAFQDYMRYSEEELARIGARGRRWLLKERKYSRLAGNYLDILGEGRAG